MYSCFSENRNHILCCFDSGPGSIKCLSNYFLQRSAGFCCFICGLCSWENRIIDSTLALFTFATLLDACGKSCQISCQCGGIYFCFSF